MESRLSSGWKTSYLRRLAVRRGREQRYSIMILIASDGDIWVNGNPSGKPNPDASKGGERFRRSTYELNQSINLWNHRTPIDWETGVRHMKNGNHRSVETVESPSVHVDKDKSLCTVVDEGGLTLKQFKSYGEAREGYRIDRSDHPCLLIQPGRGQSSYVLILK